MAGNPGTLSGRNLGTEVSGLLGLPILSLFTLTIDYRDGLVNFDLFLSNTDLTTGR